MEIVLLISLFVLAALQTPSLVTSLLSVIMLLMRGITSTNIKGLVGVVAIVPSFGSCDYL